MMDANLIIVSGIIGLVIYKSIKCICEANIIVSKNRKEEAKYKYSEMQIKKELKNSKN